MKLKEETVSKVEFDSSIIATCTYNHLTKTLRVEFKNKSIYEYYDVDEESFLKFKYAESQGHAISDIIKGKFDYRKLTNL